MARHPVSASEAIVVRPPNRLQQSSSLPTAAIGEPILANPDASQSFRNRFGRRISADVIELALLAANRGSMRDITDLSRETIDNDPHLGAVLEKRLGGVSALPWEIRPAEGPNVDEDRAQSYAAIVRQQLKNLKYFRGSIQDIAWALYDGRAALEVNWQRVNLPSDVGPVLFAVEEINWIHPRRINFGPHRELMVVPETVGTVSSGNFAPIGFSLDDDVLKQQRLFRRYITWEIGRQFGEYAEREGLATRAMYWSFFKRFAQRDCMELLELFGKPWRVGTVPSDSDASQEDIVAAKNILDGLGYSYSAILPRGVDFEVIAPGDTAGKVHNDVIERTDKQISKLVLGQTGTTDGMAGGLNTSQSVVMSDEQLLLRRRDAQAISEVVTCRLTDGIVEVNYGEEALIEAPRFVLRSDIPPDRKTELERLDGTLKAGLPVAVEEAYDVTGFRVPEANEAVVRIAQPPPTPGSPVPPAPRAVISYPDGDAPPPGDQQDDPDVSRDIDFSDLTVNEERDLRGLPALTLPDGSPDPDGELTIEEFEKKQEIEPGTAEIEAAVRTTVGRSFSVVDSEEIALGMIRINSERLEEERAAEDQMRALCVHCATEAFPETALGSPDELVTRGEKELWRVARGWANKFEAAVRGLDRPMAIFNALTTVAEEQNINAYARPLERRLRQGLALGALDNSVEIGQLDNDGNLVPDWATASQPAPHDVVMLEVPNFAALPFAQAMRWFRARGVMTRAKFELMSAAVKQRSFTVAGIQSQQMLRVLQDELGKQVGAGADLRGFAKDMEERLRSAGMVASKLPATGVLSASHIENVARTNTANAYHAGRHAHMTQPAVLRARPIWEHRAVNDRRTRKTHNQRFKLFANDPFWRTAYPPYGFQCRCRVVSLPASESSGVVSGSSIRGLPDKGFTSGVATLI
jgi:SPP1 gp7 family putative phage head morphogenesis protein